MKYQIIWLPDAEEELTQIWLEAVDKAAVTQAVYDIEQALKFNPLEHGESRGGTHRAISAGPVVVAYEPFPDDLRVQIISIKAFPRKQTS
jgi:hypothetical protein